MPLFFRLATLALASSALACSSTSSSSSDSGTDGGHDTGPIMPPDSGKCSVDSGKPHDAGRDARGPTDGGKPEPDCSAGDSGAGLPSLSALDVTSLTLTPAFSPGIVDYYVSCVSGSNAVTVTAKAASGATAALAVESPSSPTGTFKSVGSPGVQATASLTLDEGQAVVATVTEGKASQEYWVRCLPHDFPHGMEWKINDNGCERSPGYYVIGTMSLPINDGPYAIVFDTNGVPVWYQRQTAGNGVYDVESPAKNTISYGGGEWVVDSLGGAVVHPVVDPYDGGAPTQADVHELRVLPNGHFMALSSPSITGIDLTGLSFPLPDGGMVSYGKNETILACEVQEFDSSGKVFWEWSAHQHLDPAKVMQLLNDPYWLTTSYVQPFHCNSIDVDTSGGDANTGNVLVSARDANSIFYVDKKTGKILWKMGGSGPDSMLDSPKPVYVPVADPFVGQHDARLLSWKETCSGGSGQVTVFDDESLTGNPARGVVYDVIVNDGSGCAGGTTGKTGATVAFEYKTWKNVPSQVCGSFRIGADGSRVIGWGQSQPLNGLVFTEVDSM
jgi:hypothetical protein